ncbi:MAG TPA: hypothetical protein VLQ93_21615, partial [Myxococcaceae bacterium]|nr:hypothetical protein [Myxococcaceae bacterium]
RESMRYLGWDVGPYQSALVACWPALGPLLERWKCCMNPRPQKNENGLSVDYVFDCEHGL